MSFIYLIVVHDTCMNSKQFHNTVISRYNHFGYSHKYVFKNFIYKLKFFRIVENNPGFNNNVLSNKLKDYFKNNIKIFLRI